MNSIKSRSSVPSPSPRGNIQNVPSLPNDIKSILIASVATLIFGLLLSLISTGFAYTRPDPDALTAPLSIAVIALCGLFGGGTTMRLSRHQPLLCGLFCGGFLLLVSFLLTSLLPSGLEGQWMPSMKIGLRVGLVFFCILGALLADNFPGKTRKSKHTHPKARKR